MFAPTAENFLALLTLSSMEIVLGIDNIVFIAILVGRLPEAQRGKARQIGLFLAMLSRVLLLFTLSAMMKLTAPLFVIPLLNSPFSGRDLILLLGGLFLIGKATTEIHERIDVEAPGGSERQKSKPAKFSRVLLQIMVIDIVFSLDSVITAIGMASDISVMVVAVLISVGVMMFFAKSISDFIEKNPTLKMLALSFLMMIGVMLVADAFGKHIDKGYIYFAMAFSLGVEVLNLRSRRAVLISDE